eukprot:361360-Chlamydomonas_euryale.AAC.2
MGGRPATERAQVAHAFVLTHGEGGARARAADGRLAGKMAGEACLVNMAVQGREEDITCSVASQNGLLTICLLLWLALCNPGAKRKVPAVAPCRDFLNLPGHTKLIPRPEIRAAAAERALHRQAWWDAIKILAPLEFKKPQQA